MLILSSSQISETLLSSTPFAQTQEVAAHERILRGTSLLVQGCICVPGYELLTLSEGQPNQTKSCVSVTSTFDSHKTMIVSSVTAVTGAGTVAAIITGLLWLLRVHIAAFTLQRAKKRGAPGEHSCQSSCHSGAGT